MAPLAVNVDNFVRAETDRMFAVAAARCGGVNRLHHNREPTSVHHQGVIRSNRDTLYSTALVDVSEGATIELPDAGGRYLSAMVIDQDHYLEQVLHEPGSHGLSPATCATPYVVITTRILVDASDPTDVEAVHRLQDALVLQAASANEFTAPDYDVATLDATRNALLELARGLGGFERAFGPRHVVDPVRHLLGTAAGWGGLPETEAYYLNVEPGLPVGEYRLRVTDVPVDAFWSISVYNADGYFVPNDRDAYNINSVMAQPDVDGAVTVHFGGCDDGRSNCLPIMDGWNYTVRLYRPRPEILRGAWTFPAVERI
jgi:hypothetical protein